MSETSVPCWTCGGPMPASEAMWVPEPTADGGVEDVQAATCAACVARHQADFETMEG